MRRPFRFPCLVLRNCSPESAATKQTSNHPLWSLGEDARWGQHPCAGTGGVRSIEAEHWSLGSARSCRGDARPSSTIPSEHQHHHRHEVGIKGTDSPTTRASPCNQPYLPQLETLCSTYCTVAACGVCLLCLAHSTSVKQVAANWALPGPGPLNPPSFSSRRWVDEDFGRRLLRPRSIKRAAELGPTPAAPVGSWTAPSPGW